MKNKKMILGIAIVEVIGFIMIACNKSGGSGGSVGGGGEKTLNSPEALKEYLDSQPANSPDKPIKVSMEANELMLSKIRDVLNSAGKYVSLNLTGNALTSIPDDVFSNGRKGCKTLVSITIPNGVTSIGEEAFSYCDLTSITIPNSVTNIEVNAFLYCDLTNVTFQGTIPSSGFDSDAFMGDLRDKYLAGGPGTYTTTPNPEDERYQPVWTKK